MMFLKTLNPFHIQRYFGQNIITSDSKPGGKYHIIWNGLILVIVSICFIHTLATNQKWTGDLRYNFISQIRYCIYLYFGPLMFIQITLTITLFRNRYINCFNKLQYQDELLAKINVKTNFKTGGILLCYCVVFFTVIPMTAFDIYTFGDRYTMTFFFTQYFPCLAVTVHLIGISMIFLISTSKFQAINTFLSSLVRNDLTAYEKYLLNKKGVKPPVLLDYFPGENSTVYQIVLNMHNDITMTIRSLNNICGYDLTMFIAIVTFAMLSFIYDLCNDLALHARGLDLPPRTVYAPEYWSLIGVFVLMLIISSASKLTDTSSETKIHLHQLRNTYTQLNEHVESLSLQLMHSQIKINAAKFFTIHVGIMYNLVSAWITYIIIFMQLNTDIATVDTD